MDDKSLNLWRQIEAHRLSGGQPSTTMRSHAKLESCRRRPRKLPDAAAEKRQLPRG